MLRTLYREFHLGLVSTRDSTPIREIFEVLVRGLELFGLWNAFMVMTCQFL